MTYYLARDFRRLRHEMVERAIFARGVRSESVLDSMRKVPREAFLPQELREFAYETPRCRSKRVKQFPSPTSLPS
jgi:protein-L-isoaspartate O-methyltransferase